MSANRNETASGEAIAAYSGHGCARYLRRLLAAVAVSIASAGVLAQEVTLRWADVVPASHPSAQMIERIAAEVKAKSGGRIAVQGFPGGQLGSSRDQVDRPHVARIRRRDLGCSKVACRGGRRPCSKIRFGSRDRLSHRPSSPSICRTRRAFPFRQLHARWVILQATASRVRGHGGP